ncbi:S41 family peptidase [Calycomorphotria hydatis]|uniref:Putative CtpA-like serine protease n=1 Tax=Calycomorphotria hydatis TaxID=2528027 RepID=A0A517T9F6_9PLAN|nr:S41 family peptidase [Calycomorphotria hydatis]QDT65007.1 putative CtpA-like serine protease [Calycomorphotria hydatis]
MALILVRRAWMFLVLPVVIGGMCLAAEDGESEDDYFNFFREFVDSVEQIDRNYVKEVDRKKLLQAAIRGMVNELDPYSSYIPPRQIDRFNQEIDQEFGGVGIQVQIDPETERLMVSSPLPGTPAYKAGVLAGDIIIDIDGTSTKGMTLDEAVKLMKGRAGEPVTLKVAHRGREKIESITVVRDIIQLQTVLGDRYGKGDEWEYFLEGEDKIAYVRLSHFSRRTAQELRGVVRDLVEGGMKGMILDLRFNPGGLLSQAAAICDMFIESGVIVSTKGRNTPERVWEARRGGTFDSFPMVILVNRFSASASEIVSACLQDHDRAVIIGERTWGKGSVQTVIDLGQGNSALKLTTAGYYRPSGKNIHRYPDTKEDEEWGVMPNEGYEVRFTDQDFVAYSGYSRQRDIIGEAKGEPVEFDDPQLAKAIEYLNGVLHPEAEKESSEPAEAEKPVAP